MEKMPWNAHDLFARDILARGRSEGYANKMGRVARRFRVDVNAEPSPEIRLRALAPAMTQATVNDLVTRLRVYGRWVDARWPGRGAPWSGLPRIEAGLRARDRASFQKVDVNKLIHCEEIPRHRRAFYAVQARLGLRPVEAGRVRAEHIVRRGAELTLRLPASCQKSGREDSMSIAEHEALTITENLPLLRKPLEHFERTFRADLAWARVDATEFGVARRMYDLRSFFVTKLFEDGFSVPEVQRLARHSDPEITMRHYARFNAQLLGDRRSRAFA